MRIDTPSFWSDQLFGKKFRDYLPVSFVIDGIGRVALGAEWGFGCEVSGNGDQIVRILRILDVESFGSFRQFGVEHFGLREAKGDVLDQAGVHTNSDLGLVVCDVCLGQYAVYISYWNCFKRRRSSRVSSVATSQV